MSVCLSYSAAVSWFPARGIHLVGLIGFKVFAGETLRLWADSMAMQPQLKVGSVRRGIPTAAKYTHTGGRRRVSGFESKTSPFRGTHVYKASCRGHNIYDFQIKSSVTLVSEI